MFRSCLLTPLRRPAGASARPVGVLALAALGLAVMPVTSQAQTPAEGWSFGGVLDVAHTDRMLALGQREEGLKLGHSDLVARGPLGRSWVAQFGVAAHTHDGKVEVELEEAWLQSRALPAGLSLRAGRFASQVTPLNEQHPHADDFSERPLLHRAFLGGHWSDDGLRLNWTAPTPFLLQLGVEAFRGRRLVPEAAPGAASVGATTFTLRTGADVGTSHSWQLGVSHLRNRRDAAPHEEHDHEEHDHEDHEDEAHEHEEHEHDHAHGAEYSGRKGWFADFTWKWAPGGDNRNQQVRVNLSWARISDLGPAASSNDRHHATSLSAVWRVAPDWELGARSDRLRVQVPHDDHFHAGRLRELAVMVAYKPTHAQTLRLSVSRQTDAAEIEGAQRRSVQLQYVLSFGAHGAHSF